MVKVHFFHVTIQLFQRHCWKKDKMFTSHMLELLSETNQVGPFVHTID